MKIALAFTLLWAIVEFGQSSEEMALKIRFRRGGKLRSTAGNKCTIEERDTFLQAVRAAMEESISKIHDEEPPWWCYGLCRHHEEGEYCAVIHPHCPLEIPQSSIDAATARKLHENRMLLVRELGPQTHPSELRRDRSTSDQKVVCRGTRISFLTRIRDHLGTNMVSNECITFLKQRFDITCYAVQPKGEESFQLSLKPQEVMGKSDQGSAP